MKWRIASGGIVSSAAQGFAFCAPWIEFMQIRFACIKTRARIRKRACVKKKKNTHTYKRCKKRRKKERPDLINVGAKRVSGWRKRLRRTIDGERVRGRRRRELREERALSTYPHKRGGV